MESLIKLTVRTPNQRFDDIQVDCDLRWTVRKLKEYLEDVYPSKPCISSQKLIYLGKLLQDHVSLREIFCTTEEHDDMLRTLHIVCAGESSSSPNRKKTSDAAPAAQSSISSVSEPSPSVSGTWMDGLRQRHQPTQQPATPTSPPQTASASTVPNQAGFFHSNSYPGHLNYSNMTNMGSMYQQLPYQQMYQQMYQQSPAQQSPAQWQQMYQAHLQNYLYHLQQWQQQTGQLPTNFMSQFQGMPSPYPTPPGTPQSPLFVPSSPNSPPMSPAAEQLQHQPVSQAPMQQPQAMQAPMQQPQPQDQARPQRNVRMNAGPGGAMMEDEEEEEGVRNRDWLDWVYMLMRATMLMAIVYFYSTTSRFLLVSLLGFIIYLYQAGWLTPRRRVVPPEPPVAEPRPENEAANAENEGEANNQEASSSEANEQPAAPPAPVRPSFIRVLCTFVLSFFTSLVPQGPPPVQPN